MLEQHLDETYTEKIKATSKDIKALEESFIKGTEIPKKNLQDARRLCQTIGEHYKAEALSNYIDDLAKGISIRQELAKFNGDLSVLRDRSTLRMPEKFNTECQKAEKQIENLGEELKRISDNKITEALGRKLFEAADKLQTAQHRVQIEKDLETLQKEIDGLKTNPTTEKAVFENIATLSKNIEDNINNPKDENEKTELQKLFGKRLEELKNNFNTVVLQNAQNNLEETLKKLRGDLEEQKNSFLKKTGDLRQKGLEKETHLGILRQYVDAHNMAREELKAKCRKTIEQSIRNLGQIYPDLPREKTDTLEKTYPEAVKNTF